MITRIDHMYDPPDTALCLARGLYGGDPTDVLGVEAVTRAAQGAVCLDVGANLGKATQQFLDRGASHVYAIEPARKHCDGLRARFITDRRVTVSELAVSDHEYKMQGVTWLNAWFLAHPGTAGLPQSPGACDVEGYEPVNVHAVTLDRYLALQDTPPIRFAKIDVDGHEFRVLRGASGMLSMHRPIVQMELSYYVDALDPGSVPDFVNYPSKFDYLFVDYDGFMRTPEYVLREFPWNSSCDVLLVPREKSLNCGFVR